MAITFPHDSPAHVTAGHTVAFRALVNGTSVWCQISAEALEDHFGAHGGSGNTLIRAYDLHVDAIRTRARQALEDAGGRPVLLRTTDF